MMLAQDKSNEPTFEEYCKQKFLEGATDWNPEEHEDWELPPLELFKNYLQEYPV